MATAPATTSQSCDPPSCKLPSCGPTSDWKMPQSGRIKINKKIIHDRLKRGFRAGRGVGVFGVIGIGILANS